MQVMASRRCKLQYDQRVRLGVDAIAGKIGGLSQSQRVADSYCRSVYKDSKADRYWPKLTR